MGGPLVLEAFTLELVRDGSAAEHPTVRIGVCAEGEEPVAYLDVCGFCFGEELERCLKTGKSFGVHP